MMSDGYIGWVGAGCGTIYLVDRDGVKYAMAWDTEWQGQEIGYSYVDKTGKVVSQSFDYLPSFLHLDFAEMLTKVVEEAVLPLDEQYPEPKRNPIEFGSKMVLARYDTTLGDKLDYEYRYDWDYVYDKKVKQ